MVLADGTVHDRIIANVQTTLAAIAAGSTFWTTVAYAPLMSGNPLTNPIMPCAIVNHMGVDEDYGAIDQIECNLKLAIICALAKNEGGDWQADIRHFAEDVARALRIDFGRGTLSGNANAFDTYIEHTDIANESDNFPVSLAQVNVRVQYRHLLTDPTVAI
jgi:hypothetical protein